MDDIPITEHPDVQRLIGQMVTLQRERDALLILVKCLNRGMRAGYGHSDADRYNRDLLYWNSLIVPVLKAMTPTPKAHPQAPH